MLAANIICRMSRYLCNHLSGVIFLYFSLRSKFPQSLNYESLFEAFDKSFDPNDLRRATLRTRLLSSIFEYFENESEVMSKHLVDRSIGNQHNRSLKRGMVKTVSMIIMVNLVLIVKDLFVET